jgi:hypothetical protein
VTLEEVDVGPGVVVGHVVDRGEVGVELGNVIRVVLLTEDRDVHDVDLDVARLVLCELFRPTQVDDARNAVFSERVPAGVGERANVVRTDDGARACTSPVLGRQPAEVADVEAALPGERCHAASASAPR